MATVQDMFNTLLTLEADKQLEVPGVEAKDAEYLRQQFVKKLKSYREQLSMVGVPDEALPQSLRMRYDAAAQLALFSIGARRSKIRTFSFNIIPSTNEQTKTAAS